MPKTNYRECWWLIQAVNGEFGKGSYKKGRGYSLKDLNDLNSQINHLWAPLNPENRYEQKKKDSFRRNLINRRANIYNEFGLAILMESVPGIISGKGWGGYYYYLANPELLEEEGKKLKDIICFLAESETNRESWVKVEDIAEDYKRKKALSKSFISMKGTPSLGFLSLEGTTPRTIIGEDNLEIVQFALQFGEILTIKYGKIKAGVDINAPYSLEPYQLKEIEGRWYVIGNLYPLGHKERAEIAIYDLGRLQFADEENPDVLYEPVKGFDVWENVLVDAAMKRRLGEVIQIDLIAHTDDIADYLSKYPFCSAQERINKETFRVYRNLTEDLIVQLGAYGDELGIG